MISQMNTPMVYAMEDIKETQKKVASFTKLDNSIKEENNFEHNKSSYKIKKELSSNGNLVTQYVNEEDNKLKTIIWAKGINPPKMGGSDSEFKRDLTHINGKLQYVEYIAPYGKGTGWYDVNKTKAQVIDKNLCFAAAASNMLHWWLEQNSEYIDKYLKKNPDYAKSEELATLRDSFRSQSDSGIYKKFLKYYANKKEGFWADLLVDLIINGYTPKEGGGTNTSEPDKEKLLANGPDSRGGFFYDVFESTVLTQRRNYYSDYEGLSNDIKENILQGNLIALEYYIGNRIKHVVTIWGAEYDLNGKISAVYLSDSDDDESKGMVRYMVKNSGGAPLVSTHLGNDGSRVDYLETLSLGKEIWEEKINGRPENSLITLNLEWQGTNFTYDGKAKKPTVRATNIAEGDDVTISVVGDKVDVGTYTATTVLSGGSANKYKLPDEKTKIFKIEKAQPKVEISTSYKYRNNSNNVTLKCTVSGVNGEKPNGKVTLKNGETVIASNIEVLNGEAVYSLVNSNGTNYNITAEFSPETNGIGKNYTSATSNTININFSKQEQDKLNINPITGKRFGDGSFTLETTGGSGNGNVTYLSDKNDVIVINGNTATIVGAGTAIITAIKEGDLNYNSTIATYEIKIEKAVAPSIVYPTASSITYGQDLASSMLIGGSIEYGNFEWNDGTTIPTINNKGYSVVFKPNADTLKNYETIKVKTRNIKVNVSKANPKITLTSKISEETDSSKITLFAKIDKVGMGDDVTGTIKFISYIGDSLESQTITPVTINDGMATYIFEGYPEDIYKVKAVYEGDKNYNPVSSKEIFIDASKKTQNNFRISPINKKTYGDKQFIIDTEGGNGKGKISFESSDSSIISILGNVATIHKSGNVIITAKKDGDSDYIEAISSIPVVVNKRVLTITADSKLNIIKGSLMPELTYKVDGLVNNDKFILHPTITTSLENTNKVGEYEITISGGSLTNGENYTNVYVNGKATIIDKQHNVVGEGDNKVALTNKELLNENMDRSNVKLNNKETIVEKSDDSNDLGNKIVSNDSNDLGNKIVSSDSEKDISENHRILESKAALTIMLILISCFPFTFYLRKRRKLKNK